MFNVPGAALPPDFRAARFHFELNGRQTECGRPLSGPLLRGVFGKTLRDCVCVAQQQPCDTCAIRGRCAYTYLMDTHPDAAAPPTRETNVPRPFAFEPTGSPARFGLMLVGRALDYSPYCVFTVSEIGRRGIGRERLTFALHRVTAANHGQAEAVLLEDDTRLRDCDTAITADQLHERAAELPTDQLTLRFHTPLQLRREKRLITNPDGLTFRLLFYALLERLRSLCVHHCDEPLDVDFKALRAAACQVDVADSRLRFVDNSRHSARQRRDLNLGGFVGEVTFGGDLTPFLPFLCAGEVVHVGGIVCMGWGGMRW